MVNLTIWCFLKKLAIIGKIREMALSGKVQFTLKALRELAAMDLGLDEMDVCGILSDLKESDFKDRKLSTITGEYLYIFTPKVERVKIYLKVILRNSCIVVSFHEDLIYEG